MDSRSQIVDSARKEWSERLTFLIPDLLSTIHDLHLTLLRHTVTIELLHWNLRADSRMRNGSSH